MDSSKKNYGSEASSPDNKTSSTDSSEKGVTRDESKDKVNGPLINITIQVKNQFQPPYWDIQTTFTNNQQTLLKQLEKAADIDPRFRFACKYYGSSLGYMITEINGLSASDAEKTYWHLSTQKIPSLPVGASTYVPQDGDICLFNFTTWATSTPCP